MSSWINKKKKIFEHIWQPAEELVTSSKPFTYLSRLSSCYTFLGFAFLLCIFSIKILGSKAKTKFKAFRIFHNTNSIFFNLDSPHARLNTATKWHAVTRK